MKLKRYNKTFTPVSVDEAAHTVRVRMTDESVDRHGESIAYDGWDFTEFMDNPVVLLNHNDFELPVGRVVEVIPVPAERAYDAVVEFDVADDEGARAWGKVSRGFLKTVSVGFMNLVSDGAKLLKNSLLELSFVTIPANPNATVRSLKEGTYTIEDAAWLLDKAQKEVKSLTKFLADNKVKSNSEEATMTEEQLSKLLDDKLKPITDELAATKEALANAVTKDDLSEVSKAVEALKPQASTEDEDDTKPPKTGGGHEDEDEDEELTDEEAQAILDEYEAELDKELNADTEEE